MPVIHRRQQRAYYYPSRDIVVLPHPEQFDSQVHYYSTLLHELTHATGHALRLNQRQILRRSAFFGSVLGCFCGH
ncbi:hypothetical protein DUQ00_23355 [Salmonella bongori]|uniref:zincin-like metallopeptidase domain-containing protein n=1 Tax=Salmonella bongori TaxID=54736 RepID=UPI0009A978AD|nr:zincin-like metallopeptidase domain-containing protein [Salmonella bongori]ECC8925357.1 hypothetical protein [Salmonella bongori]ECC9599148.1 hypothetical protein [Salmonella bongori]EDP8664777.1 hypothetical protein [Salmonella bongori]EGE4656921.1 hypothetical protein [Salmonella bongori serovar 40:z35:- str. 95-0123]